MAGWRAILQGGSRGKQGSESGIVLVSPTVDSRAFAALTASATIHVIHLVRRIP
jgi:hypothetical protein